MKENGKVIVALLAGAAVGAAVGLLLAPEKGSDLRAGIADYFGELGEKTKDQALRTVDNVRSYGTNVYDKAKSRVNDAVDSVRSTVGEYAEQATEYGNGLVGNAKSELKNKANNVNSSIQDA